MRAVLDTNVLISALLWRGTPHRCVLAAEAGLYELLFAEPILDELREKLVEKFRHSSDEADDAVQGLRRLAKLAKLAGRQGWVTADPEDDKFVDAALSGAAELIVSGDHHLLELAAVEGIQIVSPRQFLDRLGLVG